jgi:hypothetical protein
MKPKTVALLIIGSVFASSPALAQRMSADDFKWISECMADNKDEPGATDEKVRIYCVCMNNKMDNNETRTITEWEKINPRARASCDREAGWR